MLKSKNIRRICVLLAMLAPVVYLFGSLFAGLTGAHGQQVFAEPVYVEDFVEVPTYVDDGSTYKYVVGVDDGESWTRYVLGNLSNSDVNFTINGVEHGGISVLISSIDLRSPYAALSYINGQDVFGSFINLPWSFVFDDSRFMPFIVSNVGVLYKLVPVPSSEVPENAGAYSDYVFKNFFAKDNFLVQIGKDVLSDSPHGFVPFASFWKYLDNNMLHMGDMQLGLMGYGYVYYCCHVLLFDIAFILVTFFLDFIQKVNDKVVGGVD